MWRIKNVFKPTVGITAILVSASMAIAAPVPRFPSGAVWNQDISQAAISPQSATIVNWVDNQGGWGPPNGTGNIQFQIDMSLQIVHANPNTPIATLVKSAGYYTPDCDSQSSIPLPLGGAIEGTANYTCNVNQNDCHLLVVSGNSLFESYKTTVDAFGVHSQCLVVWNLDAVYPAQGRGDQCTGTDAAGFPVAPLLFNADEVAAAIAVNGDLGHAIRFVMPNEVIRAGVFVHPATHAGGPTGPSSAIPYGARLRLRSNFNISGYGPGAQVVLRSLKKYGMLLSDGGNIPLTAESDRFTTTKWADIPDNDSGGFNSHSLYGVTIKDFEVLDFGTPIPLNYDCQRYDRILLDGFGP